MPFGYPLCFWKPNAVERCAQVLFFKAEHSCGCWRAGRPKGGWSTVASLACGTQGSVCVSLMCLLLSPDTGQSLSWSAGPAGWRLEHISGTPREALTMLPQEPERSSSQRILHPPLGHKDLMVLKRSDLWAAHKELQKKPARIIPTSEFIQDQCCFHYTNLCVWHHLTQNNFRMKINFVLESGVCTVMPRSLPFLHMCFNKLICFQATDI